MAPQPAIACEVMQFAIFRDEDKVPALPGERVTGRLLCEVPFDCTCGKRSREIYKADRLV